MPDPGVSLSLTRSDSIEWPIDLTDILDMRRPSRYSVCVAGDALTTRGILHGDILIADAATPPLSGRVAIVMLAG
jgi:DNA polymerase V